MDSNDFLAVLNNPGADSSLRNVNLVTASLSKTQAGLYHTDFIGNKLTKTKFYLGLQPLCD